MNISYYCIIEVMFSDVRGFKRPTLHEMSLLLHLIFVYLYRCVGNPV